MLFFNQKRILGEAYAQRCQLCTLKNSGESTGNIAVTLGVHRATLYRELSRNKGQKGCRFQQAHGEAFERKKSLAHNNLKIPLIVND